MTGYFTRLTIFCVANNLIQQKKNLTKKKSVSHDISRYIEKCLTV